MGRFDVSWLGLTARISSTSGASFLLGVLFLTGRIIVPQGNAFVPALAIGIGVSIPILAGLLRIDFKHAWGISCIIAGIGTIMLVNGFSWTVAVFLTCLGLPPIVITTFAQGLIEVNDSYRWHRNLFLACVAICFVVLGRAINIAPFATWQCLYVLVILFLVAPLSVLCKERKNKTRPQEDAAIEELPRNRLGVHAGAYLGLGLAMASLVGILAFVPGFLGDMAWVDPNPMLPGVPRAVIDRPWAPWDTIGMCACGFIVVIFISSMMMKRPRITLVASTCMFAGFIATWFASWSAATISLFIWSLAGLPLYLGAIIGVLLAILRLFKPPRTDALRDGRRSTRAAIAARAWLIVVPFFAVAAIGLDMRDIFNFNMAWLSIMVAIPAIAGGSIIAVMAVFQIAKTWHVSLPSSPFIEPSRKHKREWSAAVILLMAFGMVYTASYASYHAPLATKMQGLYMWGGTLGDWPSDVEAKVTHATVFSLVLNTTTGAVSSTWSLPENLPYHLHGIKVMPTVFLAFTDLYRMLKNQGGMLDTFISTLKNTLEITGVDGVSIDFEMLVNPKDLPPVTTDDWISAWCRIGNEACHAGGEHFLLGVYWSIGGAYTRDQVNRYFKAVDIHVENMYENHHQDGMQGSNHVIESSIENIIETYALLDDKAMMAKIMPGLPVYNYIWIDGQRNSLDESQLVPGGSAWPFIPFNMLQQVMINNSATFRWDPFSGATYSRFQMTLQNNMTITAIAWLQDTAQLARSMHVMDGYGVGGIMLWPANQPVPPGFIATLYG